jgi:hypothetical protein
MQSPMLGKIHLLIKLVEPSSVKLRNIFEFSLKLLIFGEIHFCMLVVWRTEPIDY